jgi:uncharacterized protein YjiS (DUF1127 family)
MATSLQPPEVSPLPIGVALAPRRPSPGALNRGAPALALAWHGRARQRRRLMELDDRALEDLGISRAEAERECRMPLCRPFWPAALRRGRTADMPRRVTLAGCRAGHARGTARSPHPAGAAAWRFRNVGRSRGRSLSSSSVIAPSVHLLASFTLAHPAARVQQPEACGEL